MKAKFETFYVREFLVKSTSIMQFFRLFGDRKFWKFIPRHRVDCG
jgi:hypothetical protein